MLDLAHLDSDTVVVRHVAVDLAEQVREVTRLLHPLAAEKGLRLESIVPEMPAVTDPALLYRILNNLVGNAIKFTEQGHVVVRVTSAARHVVIHVEDTGPGISEEFLPFLYDEFSQESTGWARDHEGCGLGLSITKGLVDKLEEHLGVESVKGRGSRFTVSLPHRAAPVEALAA